MIEAATSAAAAATSQGNQRRSSRPASGASAPSAATIAVIARAASSRSTTSKASQALTPAPYQSRKRLTSRSRLPAATMMGPSSNLRVMSAPGRVGVFGIPHARWGSSSTGAV